jgi:hypothetical protein
LNGRRQAFAARRWRRVRPTLLVIVPMTWPSADVA